MEKALFSITCTTCRARLGVRNEQAVGAILECPKCRSMVQVIAPVGWQPETPPVGQSADSDASAVEGAANEDAAESGPEADAGVEAELADVPALGLSPAELAWRKWLLLGGLPAAGLVVVIGVGSIFFWRGQPAPRPSPMVQQPAESVPDDQPPEAEQRPEPPPAPFDCRWLPDRTTLFFSIGPAQLAGEPNLARAIDQFAGPWRPAVDGVLASLGVKPEGIRRLSWASTDLRAWPEQSVVLIELGSGQDAAALGAMGEAVDLELAGVPCRHLPDAAWKHPFAVIDRRTIVTGELDLLRRLAGRSEVDLRSAAIERLLPLAAPGAELTLLVDLAAARKADWRLPAAVLDAWPAGRQPWHVLWEMSEGLGCRLQSSDGFRSELVLACEGETAADMVYAAMDELILATGTWLSLQIEALSTELPSTELPSTELPSANAASEEPIAAAAEYELLLQEGLAFIGAAQGEVADGTVRFISKDIDPRVLEQLATINGQRNATVVTPEESPVGPEPRPEQPEPEPPEQVPDEDPAEAEPEAPGERRGPIQVDVEARLADTVPEIQLRKVPLGEAIGLLSAISTVPMTIDPEALEQLGVTLHDPVTVELSGATVDQALERVVSSRGLAVVVENGQVLLTGSAQRREQLRRVRYTVSDLTGQESTAVAELAATVRKLVAPDSWRPSGGRGSVKPDGGALDVVQTGVVHHQIVTFCEKLRIARGKPLRSKFSPDRFALDTRLDRAKATLDRAVTANFHQPTPLIEVLAYLGQLAETDILVDRLGLVVIGLSDRTDASVTAEKRPLGEALKELLDPLELQYRVIDARTLQVTSRKAVAARLELEFYRVGELLSDGRTGPALVGQIKGSLAGSTWSDVGGPAVLYFDAPSGSLIALQSQPVQAELGRLLAELRN